MLSYLVMWGNRRARFSPKIQAAVLIACLVVQCYGCWLFIDAITDPGQVRPVKAWAGALMFSLAAEPWGVILALALSRKNDT